MSDDRAKTPRTLLISDHLWEALGTMAAEMGSDRDALVNQALHTFARLNGFLLPADLARLAALLRPGSAASARLGEAALARGDRPAPTAAAASPGDVAALAQQLAASGMPRPLSAPPPVEVSGIAELSDLSEPGAAPGTPGVAAASRSLVLLSDGRELSRVLKERFLIGRGKHCDLVIHSGKVSREHAVITRQGGDWFIEDLGSSNGTWFEKRRITRRQIQEGDEYYISAEKLSCSFR
ncbi:MAG TPA: FHA domain-containing protein [Myxococcales bacterium]|nr:FHA domain-containing protein [Myxococcales bacterium]